MNASTKKQTVDFESQAEECVICADKEKIEQVIVNIISNSIKYTPEGGKIKVLLKGCEGGARIRISDNGIGVPKADIPRLFERFYRVGKARSTDEGGTGLGLAIAHEIVTSHGGDIKIESELGKGTDVIIYLPEKTALGEPEESESELI